MLDLPEVIGGTLKPDGTAGAPTLRGLAETIDAIRKEQQARGFAGRSAEEMEASLAEGEAEYESKVSAATDPNPAQPE